MSKNRSRRQFLFIVVTVLTGLTLSACKSNKGAREYIPGKGVAPRQMICRPIRQLVLLNREPENWAFGSSWTEGRGSHASLRDQLLGGVDDGFGCHTEVSVQILSHICRAAEHTWNSD